jgi:hypothetical protein
MLTREGLLAGAAQPSAERFTIALYAYLTRTPAMLIGVAGRRHGRTAAAEYARHGG